ncbi:F-box protein CPR1-like isoform X1 [Tripterygium wilfordii]|uniref:F-box protein CPR1-like isoform X1 n=1 Tax=Tripterygium wilfordii TaxID=458696 RepID=UPI0018F7F7DE|nr:F-box protein CPR1-like isoform X1 [Tripterygium wilfordii]
MADLPEDLVVEILWMLPVESLTRFKCVCKSWYYMLRSQDFISKHHQNQSKMNVNAIVTHGTSEKRHFIIFSDNMDGMHGIKEKIWASFMSTHYEQCVAGPCNGLFCIHENILKVAFWNPATREFRPLPPSPIKRPPDSMPMLFFGLGFGFECKTNDYKLVRIIKNWIDSRRCWVPQIELYSLKTNNSCCS